MRQTASLSVLGVLLTASLAPLGAQTLGGCGVFPANNIWNTPIDSLPLSAKSSAYITSIGASTGLHPDFGSGLWEGAPIGIPYVVVNASQPKKMVAFDYVGESDPGPYPIPDNPPIEGGPNSKGDRHILIVDSSTCTLYELYSAYPQTNGTWTAGSGAIFNLNGNQLRPRDWTSADAAGLPLLPGLVRYDEVLAGEIKHAIRFTIQTSQQAYVWPARHYASSNTSTNVPPMGQRFRLRASFDVSSFTPQVQVILNAMKKYGIIVADNGSNWEIGGAPDERWNNDELHVLNRVKGSDFEAVDVSGLMVNVDSAQANVPNGTMLNAVTLNPASVIGGQTTTQNTVALVGPAPNGGAVVALTSSNPGVAMVPPTATIAAGTATAPFTITTSTVPVSTQVTITASYTGNSKTAGLTVKPGALAGFSISPVSVTGGASATGTLTLGAPAPAGGTPVALSSNSSAVAVPASVTVPAASTSVAFAITTGAVTAATTATITASYAGTTLTAPLTVNAPAPSLAVTVSPASVAGGAGLNGKVTLTTAAASAITVNLVSSNTAVAAIPASVAIAAGATSATFAVTTHAVSATAQVVISASYSSSKASASLTVNAAALESISVPLSVRNGRTVTGRVHLNGIAASPYVVSLECSNTAAASIPATVTVQAGASSATFSLTARTVKAPTSVRISATYKAVAASDTITVHP